MRHRWILLTACTLLLSTAVEAQVDCTSHPVRTVVRRDPLLAPHETSEVYLESDPIYLTPGGSTTAYVVLVSEFIGEAEGPMGWSIGFNVEGNVLLSAATTEGTVADREPEGLRRLNGFEITELLDPDHECGSTGEPQGQGAVSAVVFSLLDSVTLPPIGSANILALTLEAPEEEAPLGEIIFRDHLTGSG